METFGLSTRKASWPGIPQVFPGRTVDIVFVLLSSGTLPGRNCGGKWEKMTQIFPRCYICEAAAIKTVRSHQILVTQCSSFKLQFSCQQLERIELVNFRDSLQVKFMRISQIKWKLKSLNRGFCLPYLFKHVYGAPSTRTIIYHLSRAVLKSGSLEVNVHGLSLWELTFT